MSEYHRLLVKGGTYFFTVVTYAVVAVMRGGCINPFESRDKTLCFNFYLLTLIAFSFHQVYELTDKVYQACR